MCLISVIIPVYNLEKYIDECIQSFLSQSFQDFEIIIADDGSTDNTVEKIKKYNDKRIKIFLNKRQNAGSERNFGLERAIGKWVVFFDGDDFCGENFLHKMVKKAEEFDCDTVICASAEYSERKKKFLRHRLSHTLLNLDKNLQNGAKSLYEINDCSLLELMEPWNKIYKKSFLIENGIKFQEISNSNDLLFSTNVLLKAKKISFVFDEEVYIRRRKTSLSFNINKNWKNYFEAYREADKAVFNYEHFDDIKEAWFDRKFRAYRYFFKKTNLLNKVPFLIKMRQESKEAKKLLQT